MCISSAHHEPDAPRSLHMRAALAVALQAPDYDDAQSNELYNVTHKPIADGLASLRCTAAFEILVQPMHFRHNVAQFVVRFVARFVAHNREKLQDSTSFRVEYISISVA